MLVLILNPQKYSFGDLYIFPLNFEKRKIHRKLKTFRIISIIILLVPSQIEFI